MLDLEGFSRAEQADQLLFNLLLGQLFLCACVCLYEV